MDFLFVNNTLILCILIFIISLLIGYFGEKRMENREKNRKQEDFSDLKNEQSFNEFGLLEEDVINNIF